MTKFNVKQDLTELLEDCSEIALSHKEFINLSVSRIINYYKNLKNEQSSVECGQSHIGNIEESG